MVKRVVFFLYGVICYVAFLATFLYAIGFVGNLLVPKALDGPPAQPFWPALGVDVLLLALFAVQHSVMARPGFKKAWTRVVPWTLERSTYVLCASAALALLMWQWRPLGGEVWMVESAPARALLWSLFAAGWLLVLVATFLINHFDLFGLRQVWLSLRGKPYSRLHFGTPGPYRLVRHPLYLGFVCAFWATPHMTVTHLLFAAVTTAYILVAIQLEERDLLREHGESYAAYRRHVPMLLPWRRRADRGPEPAGVKARTVGLFVIAVLASSAAAHGEKKVTLCHLPPGNAANPQTISVSEAAVSAHLTHGDRLGACQAECPSSCDDGNLCTSDSCGTDGQCVHAPASCDDGVLCTLDSCDPSVGCLRLPNDGQSCNDGNGCTSEDRCSGTECRGTAIANCCAGNADCDDSDACSDDVCFLGSCRNTARDCSVANKCLAGFCSAAGGCEMTAASCDDSNVCTDDGCDPTFGCTHVATIFPPEPTEVSCADAADNDCDGAVDAADPDCPRCGDGILQPPEECDDGNTNPFDGCDRCHLVDINPD